MRKSLLILLVLVIGLAACSPKDNDNEVTPDPVVVTEIVVVTATPEVTEEPVVPTDEPTPEPTVDPNAWRYVCGTANMETGVFQKSYNKRGDLRRNDQGNLILKVVPRSEVAHYFPGDKVCIRFDPFQVDNMKVTLVSGTRGSGYFIPTFRLDFVKPSNPNQ